MAKNSYKAWAIKSDGALTLGVFDTRKQAVTYLTGYDLSNKKDRRNTLVALRRNGWQIVPVMVTEIADKEGVE